MNTFFRCLVAELLKMKRTSALLVVLVAPYVVVLLPTLFVLGDGERFLPSTRMTSWVWLSQTVFITWCMVVFPVVLGLVTALLAALEHRAEGFRHLFALPVGRRTLYLAKQAATFLLVLLAFLLLAFGVLLAGWALRWLRPGLGFEVEVPWGLLGYLVLGGAVAAGFVVAVQTWVALVNRELAAPLGLAFLAVASLLALRAVDVDLVAYHPWSYAGEWVREVVIGGQGDGRWLVAGALGGIVFSLFTGWSFARRDVF